jgi:hypothetical protein
MVNDLAPTYPYVPVPPLGGGNVGTQMRELPVNAEGTGGNGWERVRFMRELRERVGNGLPLICACLYGNAEGTGQIMATEINY